MTKIDRTGWPSGEWDGEPDRLEWRVGNYYCLVDRMPNTGHLNGYVGVPEGHKYHFADYDDIPIRAYGGLTFNRRLTEDGDVPPHLWLFGFDTRHYGDLSPCNDLPQLGDPPTYKNYSFVRSEVWSMLYQLTDRKLPPLVTVNVEDGHKVFLWSRATQYTVLGDGADLLKRWVRFGDSHLGVCADWIEDNPESVIGATPGKVTKLSEWLRKQDQSPDGFGH